jgi:hypothetical protein
MGDESVAASASWQLVLAGEAPGSAHGSYHRSVTDWELMVGPALICHALNLAHRNLAAME